MLRTPLPPGVEVQRGNNCVGIAYFEGRLFVAWRSAPSHFASADAKIYIMSSQNNGTISWELEKTIYMQSDLREPNFLVSEDEETLDFTFF